MGEGCEGLYEYFFASLLKKIRGSQSNEFKSYSLAIEGLLSRGFDHVVFGHTHRKMKEEIFKGKFYFNPGSWLTHNYYVEVNYGKVSLKRWSEKSQL